MVNGNKVIYEVFAPSGEVIATFDSRKEAKEFIDKANKNTPSWHYDDLYKLAPVVKKCR